MQKVLQHKRRLRNIREELDRNEERFRLFSDEVNKNKMVDAELQTDLQELQRGEERRGSNASQAVDCCWERTRRGQSSMLCVKYSSRDSRFPSFPSRCQEKEDEGTVRTNKNKEEPVSSWRCQRPAGSMKVLQRVGWSLISSSCSGCTWRRRRSRKFRCRIERRSDRYPTHRVDSRSKRTHSQDNC